MLRAQYTGFMIAAQTRQRRSAPEEAVMDYLKRATKYAEDRGDELWFSDVYTRLREHFNVADSVWKALAFLYSDDVADQVEAG